MADPDTSIWQVQEDALALQEVLTLLRSSFRYMEGRIDPPSSIHRLTEDGMRAHCHAGGEIWAMGRPVVACVFLKPKSGRLYLGKLAVQDGLRGQGIGRKMVDHAEARAVALGLSELELETRIELTENHRAFSRLGFTIAGTGRHEGYDRPTDVLMRKPVSLSADN